MKMHVKLSLFLTAVSLLCAPCAHAFENLLIPATNTFDAVKQELWLSGLAAEEGQREEVQSAAGMPEEVTLGLEKWESSL